MTDRMDNGYNEGRLAFRRYFAKYGPNAKQNDPRMPPNPYVGYSGVMWLNGFKVPSCAATSRFVQRPPRACGPDRLAPGARSAVIGHPAPIFLPFEALTDDWSALRSDEIVICGRPLGKDF